MVVVVRVCDVKEVMGRTRHHVGGDDGEAVRGVKRRKRVVVCGDGKLREEGKEGSERGERGGGSGDGNTVVAPGF